MKPWRVSIVPACLGLICGDVLAAAPSFDCSKSDGQVEELICEALQRPKMHLVAVKSVAQQDIQAIHRMRDCESIPRHVP